MKIFNAENTSFRVACLVTLILVFLTAGCGSGNNNNVVNNGLFGNWNIAMFPTGSPNPSYVFALAISQEGTTYTGSPIAYNGSVAQPSNQCINTQALRSTATESGSNFTMTVTDTTTQTIITMNGTLATDTTTLTGTYTNPASTTCPASSGTFSMTTQ